MTGATLEMLFASGCAACQLSNRIGTGDTFGPATGVFEKHIDRARTTTSSSASSGLRTGGSTVLCARRCGGKSLPTAASLDQIFHCAAGYSISASDVKLVVR